MADNGKGLIAAGIAAHVPSLGSEATIPDFQRGLVRGLRETGRRHPRAEAGRAGDRVGALGVDVQLVRDAAEPAPGASASRPRPSN